MAGNRTLCRVNHKYHEGLESIDYRAVLSRATRQPSCPTMVPDRLFRAIMQLVLLALPGGPSPRSKSGLSNLLTVAV